MSDRLRVAVPAHLLELPPVGGHGKVWHRVLAELRDDAKLAPLGPGGRPARGLRPGRFSVVLASGHEDLPSVRSPLVVQVHEAGWFEPGLRDTLDPSFLEHIASRTEHAVRSASHVITPSEAARRDLIASYALEPTRVHAVHHGVDPVFAPGADHRSELVGRVRGGRTPPYVLYVATLHPRKNLAALRDAMARLAGEGFPPVLAIAGHPAPDRPDSAELQRAAAAELPGAEGRVAYLGQPSDRELAALMAGADAFCLPSLYEGFGLTVLEAMACGAPVVVSNRGALPEVVREAGIVVEPTADAVKLGLGELLSDRDRADRLGRSAAARAREFTWKRTADGWLKVLMAAADRSW